MHENLPGIIYALHFAQGSRRWGLRVFHRDKLHHRPFRIFLPKRDDLLPTRKLHGFPPPFDAHI